MSLTKKLKWGIEYAGFRTLELVLGRLSIAQVSRIGSGLGLLGHRFLADRRRVILRNLRIAFGDCLSLGELRLLTKRVFARTGANLLCSLRTPGISSTELEDILEIRHLDVLLRLIAEGKGVILLTPHMGNWELLAQLIHWLPEGARLGTHYRPLTNPWINKVVEAQRSERGTRLFAKKDSPHAMAGFLRAGGTLGILADQRAGRIGQGCSYHGRITSCSPFPELLARRTGAAIVSITLESLTPGKWRCTFRQVHEASTPACMEAMEKATRSRPGDVFWFQDRWRISRKRPFFLPVKLHKGVDPAASEKPMRLLFWLQPDDKALPPLPSGIRPDLTFELAAPDGLRPEAPDGHDWANVWTIDPSMQPEQLLPILTRIDEADQLPLDGIVTINPEPALKKVAGKRGIPLVKAPPPSPSE